MARIYGYMRVSSTDQNEARQRLALEAQAIPPERIFMDKMSGKDFKRPQYNKMVRRLRAGDQLCITSIDRLGRNYEEIQQQWRRLTRDLKVDIMVLDMPLLDTRRGKDLMGVFIADIVLQVLCFVAQHEREAIRRRQAEGIAAARRNGVRFGQRPRPLPPNFAEVHALWTRGDISTSEAARQTGMARSTFRKRAASFAERTV